MAKKDDVFSNLIKGVGIDDLSLMDDGTGSAEFHSFIDTGSYTLNAALSGSLFGGLPDNKAIAMAGPEATGKTFLLLGLIRTVLNRDEKAGSIIYDTEGATTKQMVQARGIDSKRVLLGEPTTVEDFRNKALKFCEVYEKLEEKPFFIMGLDSLGQLPTEKEIADASANKNTKDMTRAQIIKSAFRVLRLKLAKLHIPLIVTNHTYANIIGYGAPQVMSGGSGVKYAGDFILMLSKSKAKEGTGADAEVIGNVIKVKIAKSRLSRENQEVFTRILYDGGLDRYYGLLDMAVESGVFKKISTKYAISFWTEEEVAKMDQSKTKKDEIIKVGDPKELVFGKDIEDNPRIYFTEDVLKKIEPWVNEHYMYGPNSVDVVEQSRLLDEELKGIK